MGTVYKRGNVWWIRYRQNGHNVFESSKSSKKTVATKLLQSREGDISHVIEPNLAYGKTKYRDLRQGIINDYEIRIQNIKRLITSLNHLDAYFDGFRANRITTDEVRKYTNRRMKTPARSAESGLMNRIDVQSAKTGRSNGEPRTARSTGSSQH